MSKKKEDKNVEIELVGKTVHVDAEYRFSYRGMVLADGDNGLLLKTADMGRIFIVSDRIVAIYLDLKQDETSAYPQGVI